MEQNIPQQTNNKRYLVTEQQALAIFENKFLNLLVPELENKDTQFARSGVANKAEEYPQVATKEPTPTSIKRRKKVRITEQQFARLQAHFPNV